MTVAELIEQLNWLPKDRQVVLQYPLHDFLDTVVLMPVKDVHQSYTDLAASDSVEYTDGSAVEDAGLDWDDMDEVVVVGW